MKYPANLETHQYVHQLLYMETMGLEAQLANVLALE
jgi:predicted lipase